MSQVISFRLNKDNPREVKALLVLQTRKAKGYSVRQIVTEALINLEETQTVSHTHNLDQLNVALKEVGRLHTQFESQGGNPKKNTNHRREDSALADSFLASVKMSVKPGLKLD